MILLLLLLYTDAAIEDELGLPRCKSIRRIGEEFDENRFRRLVELQRRRQRRLEIVELVLDESSELRDLEWSRFKNFVISMLPYV